LAAWPALRAVADPLNRHAPGGDARGVFAFVDQSTQKQLNESTVNHMSQRRKVRSLSIHNVIVGASKLNGIHSLTLGFSMTPVQPMKCDKCRTVAGMQ
jgi:hypothetical protein